MSSALTYSVPAIWSDLALIQLKKALVWASPVVVNHDYEGEIQDYGSSVKIHGVADPTISAYTNSAGLGGTTALTYAKISDFEKVLSISKADSFAFGIDDIDTKQMLPKLMPQAMARAAYQLAVSADNYVAGVVTGAAGTTATDANFTSPSVLGTTTAPVAISPAAFSDPTSGEAAYEWLVDLSTALDEVAVPRQDRYVIVPPWFIGLLSKDLRFTGYQGYGTGTVLTDGFAGNTDTNGLAGRAAGFNVVMSLDCPSATFTTPSSSNPYLGGDNTTQNYYQVVAGVPSATTFAHQIVKTEAIRNPNGFSDLVRGLHVYGCEVVWPERIVGAYIAQGTATTH